MAHPASRSAFTLIEAMVVVILMSIIAVTVMPALNNLDKARQGAAADELIRLLTQARALAMASGRPVGVSIDLEEDAALIVQISAAGGPPTPATGALVGAFTQDATVELSGSKVVTVRRGTGLVE
jgi:Tfp pilus assembly protein FimT